MLNMTVRLWRKIHDTNLFEFRIPVPLGRGVRQNLKFKLADYSFMVMCLTMSLALVYWQTRLAP
jgi:hypothetical protein